MFRDNRCAYCMSVSKDVEEQLKKLETLLGKYSDTIENLPFREKMIINNFLNLLTSSKYFRYSFIASMTHTYYNDTILSNFLKIILNIIL